VRRAGSAGRVFGLGTRPKALAAAGDVRLTACSPCPTRRADRPIARRRCAVHAGRARRQRLTSYEESRRAGGGYPPHTAPSAC
jgi:hypothetical protein